MATTTATIAKIKLKTNGLVELLNASDGVRATLSPFSDVRRIEGKNGLLLIDINTKAQVILWIDKLTHYIIDPAPAVAYSADIWDWWKLIRRFFLPVVYPLDHSSEVINGSGLVAGDSVTDALNNLATAMPPYQNVTAAGGAYSILTTDYHIYNTANNSTFTLPTIGVNYNQEYKVWVRNFTGFKLTCDTGAGDRIIGATIQNLPKWSAVIVRCFTANEWLII